MVSGDGSCTVDLNNCETATHHYNTGLKIYYNDIYYYGYETLEEMYEDCVMPQMDFYNIENNVAE